MSLTEPKLRACIHTSRGDSHADFTRIALRAGKPAEYRKALTDSIQRGARRHIQRAERRHLHADHASTTPTNFVYDNQYLNVQRTDDLVMIQTNR